MSLGSVSVTCKHCAANRSAIWRKEGTSEFVCQTCYIKQELKKKKDVEDTSNNNNNGGAGNKQKSTNKSKTVAFAKGRISVQSNVKSTRNRVATKGRSRRAIFKSKNLVKLSTARITDRVTDFVCHRGQYYQIGDIVSVVDRDDRKVYFAQCTGFLTNRFSEKFVSYTWLLPTRRWTQDKPFDPSAFYIGPVEDFPHHMDSVRFVCNAPADYYKPLNSFYPVNPVNTVRGGVSVNMSRSVP